MSPVLAIVIAFHHVALERQEATIGHCPHIQVYQVCIRFGCCNPTFFFICGRCTGLGLGAGWKCCKRGVVQSCFQWPRMAADPARQELTCLVDSQKKYCPILYPVSSAYWWTQCLLNQCQHQLCCGPWPHVAANATCALSANCKTCCCTIVIVVHKGSKEDTQTHTTIFSCLNFAYNHKPMQACVMHFANIVHVIYACLYNIDRTSVNLSKGLKAHPHQVYFWAWKHSSGAIVFEVAKICS